MRPRTLPCWEVPRQPVDNRVKLTFDLALTVTAAIEGEDDELIETDDISRFFTLLNAGRYITIAGSVIGLPSNAHVLGAPIPHAGDALVGNNGMIYDSVEWAKNSEGTMDYIIVWAENNGHGGKEIGIIMPDGYYYPYK